MTRRVGLLVGSDTRLEHALMAALEGQADIRTELAVVGGIPDGWVCPYDVILDRVSHRVPCYRRWVTAAALAGSAVINDPLRSSGHDKFLALSVARRLGIAIPRTVLLPQNRYGAEIDPARSLRNLEYPLDWQSIGSYVGYPAILRGTGLVPSPTTRVTGLDGLWRAFDQSGESVTMLQQALDGFTTLQVVCVAGERAVVLDGDGLGAPERQAVSQAALTVTRALGYELNQVEVAVLGGQVAVLDASEPYPELDPGGMGPAFDTVVGWLAERSAGLARRPDEAVGRARQALGVTTAGP